jgi:hypothetical protein
VVADENPPYRIIELVRTMRSRSLIGLAERRLAVLNVVVYQPPVTVRIR